MDINSENLPELNSKLTNSSMELESFVVSHARLIFRVHYASGKNAFIGFSGAHFIDCPAKMENIVFTIDQEKIKPFSDAYFSPEVGRYFRRHNLYTIDCVEGSFSIFAAGMWYSEGDETSKEIKAAKEGSIWVGGPRFSDFI